MSNLHIQTRSITKDYDSELILTTGPPFQEGKFYLHSLYEVSFYRSKIYYRINVQKQKK